MCFCYFIFFVRRELKFCCYDAFPVRKNDWRGVSLSGKTYSRGMTWGRPDSIWKFYLENFFSENLHLVIIHGSLIAQTNKFGWCYKFHNCFFFDRTISNMYLHCSAVLYAQLLGTFLVFNQLNRLLDLVQVCLDHLFRRLRFR